MDTNRITVRLPLHDLRSVDLFIRVGEFSCRSEAIRRAVSEFVKAHADEIIAKADRIKKVQELEAAVEAIEPYMKK
jgi:Arc/MetJ-type ribon-helix-helix transcriptional regulator